MLTQLNPDTGHGKEQGPYTGPDTLRTVSGAVPCFIKMMMEAEKAEGKALSAKQTTQSHRGAKAAARLVGEMQQGEVGFLLIYQLLILNIL